MSAYFPPATRALLLANIAVFILELLTGGQFNRLFALEPIGPNFHVWQILTYAFLHGGFLHILFNMFALWMFGSPLERFFGKGRYLAFYFASVVAAALVQLATTTLSGLDEGTIGASGGIFGLLLAYGFYFPRDKVIVLLLPIPIPAWLFVTLYGIVELVLGVTGTESGVAHFAHLGGMLGAALMILYWRALEKRRQRNPW